MSQQFESMLEGLNEAIEYLKGDKTKGRSRVVEISDLLEKDNNVLKDYEILTQA